MKRFIYDPDRREDWTCFFCCHVRTATIFLGLWHLMLHIMALAALTVLVHHPELSEPPLQTTDPLVTDDPLESPLPTPLSKITTYSKDSNMNTQISLVSFASCLALIYGAMKGKPLYLLPLFCLKVFDFCITCVFAISVLCSKKSFDEVTLQSGPEIVRRQLHTLSPATIGMIEVLVFTFVLTLKAYFLSIIWRCYRYLSLRRVSERATVSILGAPGYMESGQEFDLHANAAATAASTSGNLTGPTSSSTVAPLNPPEYSKLDHLPPYTPPTPPPPYSSVQGIRN